MLRSSSTWEKIDALKAYLVAEPLPGDLADKCNSTLRKLYLLAWLEAFQYRHDEALLMRISASQAWLALPTYIRKELSNNGSNQSGA